MRIRFYIFPVVFFCLVGSAEPAPAGQTEGTNTRITAGLGIENLNYEENLPEISLRSSVKVSSFVARIEGIRQWEHVFVGIKGTAPLIRSDNREEWFVNGTLDQTNSLTYGIFQFAGFVGYPAAGFFNPYLGLRSNLSIQERSDFKTFDDTLISSAEITEKVIAHFISLGVMGSLPVSEKWEIDYGAEYNLPYYSKVTNDGLSGWIATDIDGYLWSVHTEIIYALREKVSLSFFLGAGQQHWEGSGWQSYNDGRVKWPENDTYFLSSLLNIIWNF